ncbi:NAD-aldehyde dehydrogenase [Trametes coccinea BRFM310]|uniref:Aldehyde dehydrogenase n=1 Tax=Trametes coccinea (strain BRFM310) TaxID=1353009 RepID=A0A1Y2I8R8_TRAC3|nr:NAD-aldehyde dehydrogenase [Trametes coccinea BRFM310]
MSSSTSFHTPMDEISQVHERARQAYRSGKAKSIAFRKEQIAQVSYLLKDNEDRFVEALKSDLGRPAQETVFFDFAASYLNIKLMYDNVEKWTKSRRAGFNLSFAPMSPRVKAEPKGTVLVIGPFNVPVFMLVVPLAGAIAGGNAVVLKPSEKCPACAKLMAELVPKYLDNEMFHVVNGGIPETTRLLELQWDHIFFTGSNSVGRIVAQAAAKHLTPLTLELGGKNPVVVDPRSDFHLAAKRTLWGRVSNAGQICLAPEYVLIPRASQDAFVEAVKEVYASFYPEGPAKSDSLSRVVTEAQATRIKRLLDESQGTIVFGGDVVVAERYVAPTLVKDVAPGDSLMSEEIFGPVLPIVPVQDVDEAIEIIKSRGHPLAIYAFSRDKTFLEKVFDNTESGAAVANDTVVNGGVPGLPGGGIGASGYGYATGKELFEQFTHIRVSLNNPAWVDNIGFGFRYPPYTKKENEKQLRFLSPALPPRPKKVS